MHYPEKRHMTTNNQLDLSNKMMPSPIALITLQSAIYTLPQSIIYIEIFN